MEGNHKINFYDLYVELPGGKRAKIKPSTMAEVEMSLEWWQGTEWYILFDDKLILTQAGEVADLFYDIQDLQIDMIRFKDSKKRQHKVHVRHLKETIRFLRWVFKYCERNEIGTTAFYALLATDNIDDDESGL